MPLLPGVRLLTACTAPCFSMEHQARHKSSSNLARLQAVKEAPPGVSAIAVLQCLAGQAAAAGAHRLAGSAHQRLQRLRLPPADQVFLWPIPTYQLTPKQAPAPAAPALALCRSGGPRRAGPERAGSLCLFTMCQASMCGRLPCMRLLPAEHVGSSWLLSTSLFLNLQCTRPAACSPVAGSRIWLRSL